MLARCPRSFISKYKLSVKSLVLKLKGKLGADFSVLARCPGSFISKYKLSVKSLMLKVKESRCRFLDFGQVPQILYIQIQTLSQKLSFEGKGIHLQISRFWPGVSDFVFPNTNF